MQKMINAQRIDFEKKPHSLKRLWGFADWREPRRKAGEAPFIEEARDKTAEEIAGVVAQENGIPMPEQMGNTKTAAKAGDEEIIPVLEERTPGLLQSADGKIKVNTIKKMHQDGKHYNKHGRTKGYASKKEYDQAAKEFAIANMNNSDAKVYRGKWNGKGDYNNEYQIIIIYNGRQVVLHEETGKVIDFLEGTELKGQISVEELR